MKRIPSTTINAVTNAVATCATLSMALAVLTMGMATNMQAGVRARIHRPRDEQGIAIVEMILILVVLIVIVMVVMHILGSAVNSGGSNVANCITNPSGSNC